MKPVRIGLIGCGWFAQSVHLPVLTGLPGVSVVALAEPDPDRLQAAGVLAPEATRYGDYLDLLQQAAADAVVVCVPTAVHREATIAALSRGRHVYLEKPIATDLEEARAIVDAWDRARVIGMIGFNYRCNPLHRSAKAIVQSGALGRIVGVRSVFTTQTRSLPEWKRHRRSGGGALRELGSHHIDLARYYFGEDVRSVFAGLRSIHTEEDTATLHLTLVGGIDMQSCFSLSAVEEDRFEVLGDAGKLTVDRYSGLQVEVGIGGGVFSRVRRMAGRLNLGSRGSYLLKRLRSPWHEPSYREALSSFAAAVRHGGSVSPDLLDGYRSLEVICAAEESAQTGRSISVGPSGKDS